MVGLRCLRLLWALYACSSAMMVQSASRAKRFSNAKLETSAGKRESGRYDQHLNKHVNMAMLTEMADRNALAGKMRRAGWPRLSAPRGNRTRHGRSSFSSHSGDDKVLISELRVVHSRAHAKLAAEHERQRGRSKDSPTSEDHMVEDPIILSDESELSNTVVVKENASSKEESILAKIADLDAKLAAAMPHDAEDGLASASTDSTAVEVQDVSSGANDTGRLASSSEDATVGEDVDLAASLQTVGKRTAERPGPAEEIDRTPHALATEAPADVPEQQEHAEDSKTETAETLEHRLSSSEAFREAESPASAPARPLPALIVKEKMVVSAPSESGMAEHMAAFLSRMHDRQHAEVLLDAPDARLPPNMSDPKPEPELLATISERPGLNLLSVREEDFSQPSKNTEAPVKLAADHAAWFNVPKSGSAFANVLATWACPDLEDGDRIATRGDADAPASFIVKQQEKCAHGFNLCHRPFGNGEGVCTRAWEDRAGGFVGMFRQPEQRILAQFLEAQGNGTDGEGSKALSTFAEAQGGCAVRMLNGEECDSSIAVTSDMTRLAIQRMESGFAFVGLTEEWALSVCLFHAMLGGPCHAREFKADAPPRSIPYDATHLHGWVDAFDGALYSHVSSLFWNRISQYEISADTCMKDICIDAADDFKKSILHKR